MGLTQAELAGADLSKSFVSLLETARSYPSVETLLLLARRAGTGELRLDTALSLRPWRGRVAAARKDRSKAIRYLRESAQQLKALGLKDLWAEVSCDLGLLIKGGTPEAEAVQYLTQAINPEALLGGTAAVRTRAPARRAVPPDGAADPGPPGPASIVNFPRCAAIQQVEADGVP